MQSSVVIWFSGKHLEQEVFHGRGAEGLWCCFLSLTKQQSAFKHTKNAIISHVKISNPIENTHIFLKKRALGSFVLYTCIQF